MHSCHIKRGPGAYRLVVDPGVCDEQNGEGEAHGIRWKVYHDVSHGVVGRYYKCVDPNTTENSESRWEVEVCRLRGKLYSTADHWDMGEYNKHGDTYHAEDHWDMGGKPRAA